MKKTRKDKDDQEERYSGNTNSTLRESHKSSNFRVAFLAKSDSGTAKGHQGMRIQVGIPLPINTTQRDPDGIDLTTSERSSSPCANSAPRDIPGNVHITQVNLFKFWISCVPPLG
jgi:hypothetical protein